LTVTTTVVTAAGFGGTVVEVGVAGAEYPQAALVELVGEQAPAAVMTVYQTVEPTGSVSV
jgi:hypothetical protein